LFLNFSGTRLNDPQFIRLNHAIICFKKFDANLSGKISTSDFERLVAMLQENQLVGKVSIIRVIGMIDSASEGFIHYNGYVKWINSVSFFVVTFF
jgi:Ca2+-binding EF-hand superfamily protein